jgi:phosphoribosylaminoimidazole-succinocarboxamide synthase
MTPEVVAGITERYIELYEAVTGEKFVRGEADDVEARIERNVSEYLKTL